VEEPVEEPKTGLRKHVLTSYIQSRCDRQLFLLLGEDSPTWLSPLRPVKKQFRKMVQTKFLEELGHDYEQKVYQILIQDPNAIYRLSDKGQVSKTFISKELMKNYHEKMQKNQYASLILLEHEFKISRSYLKFLFPPKIKPAPSVNSDILSDSIEIGIDIANIRPDIIFIIDYKDKTEEPVYELLPTGALKEIPLQERSNRFGLSIIDIKTTEEEYIGKKQFMEILYYMMNLSHILIESGLNQYYFVSTLHNGIFPHRELSEITSKTSFLESIIPLHYTQSNQIYFQVHRKIQELWQQAPCPIEQIPTLIQPSCGYCQYLEDCKITLGYDVDNPQKMSLQLIPYTSQSISKQLLDRGFKTIEDVAKNIGSIKIGATPEPLYPELKYLELKAKAILKGELLTPVQSQSYSFALPRYSDMALIFAAESDPMNDQVFAVCLYLNAFVSQHSQYSHVFNSWWKIWRDAREHKWQIPEIKSELDQVLFNSIPLEDIEVFQDALNTLSTLQIKLINEPDDDDENKINAFTQINYRFTYVNQSLAGSDEEANLAKNFVIRLHAIVELCNLIEQYANVRIVGLGGKEIYLGPVLGVFYWSTEQLKNLQGMLERHLTRLSDDSKISDKFNKILTWITPSDSAITHPYQHKKFYDLQTFAETAIGFPGIINYTWHELAFKMKNLQSNQLYWIPHFNYMDFHPWYRFLMESDKTKKAEYETEIKRQIIFKATTINALRQEFQKHARGTISKSSYTMKTRDYVRSPIKASLHPIARLWYFYSKMSGTLDEIDQEYFRTTYPEFSIGKLVAAEVSNLKIYSGSQKKYKYSFNLVGLSRNMKINENDRVLLLPDEKRENILGPWARIYTITISSLVWDDKIDGFKVESLEIYNDLLDIYQQEFGQIYTKTRWFLYPTPNDPWTHKLIGENGLFERKHFGETWLGFRLAALWKIRMGCPLTWPSQLTVNLPEIYLFYPQLLFASLNDINAHQNFKQPNSTTLKTTCFPPPDPSQKLAIINALQSTIFAIQGPPGTGKSQTIAALVDEFLLRSPRPVRILITAFSYAALFVIIDKIRKSRDKENKPTQAARTQLIFIHTADRDPIASIPDCRNVDDIQRSGDTWKWNGQGKTLTKKKHLEDLLESASIIFANAHQLYHLNDRVNPDFYFDLILVDEASQLPIDQFMASLQFVRDYQCEIQPIHGIFQANSEIKNIQEIEHFQLKIKSNADVKDEIPKLTKVIIVGDHNQLPPVQNLTPPKNIVPILDSLFGYYVKYHQIPTRQLQLNYRSHRDIVQYTAQLGIYQNLEAFVKNATRTLSIAISTNVMPWLKEVLDPEKIVLSIIHQRNYEVAVSAFEAELVSCIIIEYYSLLSPPTEAAEIKFWEESVGIVSPHNAQGRLIIHRLFQEFSKGTRIQSKLSPELLMQLLKKTIYSVEKFQGSDRDLIIASIGVSDLDQLQAEAEFIYDLNRFNVLTSRAKSKIIFIANMNFLNYIPEKLVIMEEAALIREYTSDFCNKQAIIFPKNEVGLIEPVYIRWKDQNYAKSDPMQTFHIGYKKLSDQEIEISYENLPEINHILEKQNGIQLNPRISSDGHSIQIKCTSDQIIQLQKYLPLPREFYDIFQQNSSVLSQTGSKAPSIVKKTSKTHPKLNIDFDDEEKPLF
jgi:hypothetical protein